MAKRDGIMWERVVEWGKKSCEWDGDWVRSGVDDGESGEMVN